MIQRIALLAVSIAAAFALATGLALAGFGPASPAAPAADAQAAQPVDPVAEPAASTVDPGAPLEAVQVDTVYLAPAPAPEVIVTKLVRTQPAGHGGGEQENEGEDD